MPDEQIRDAMDRLHDAREREEHSSAQDYHTERDDLEDRTSEAIEAIRRNAERPDRSTGAIE